MEAAEKAASQELERSSLRCPNLPADDVPDGTDETGNVEHHRFGAKRDYAAPPKQHFDLGEALGQMDFETAAKLSGSRFVVLKKGLARMERALGQFMLDVHTGEHGYTEIAPPLAGARRRDVRHRAIAEIRRRSVLGCCLARSFGHARLADSAATGSSRPPKCRSPISSATPSSTKPSCRCASPPARRASAPRRERPARTRAA